MSTWCACGCVLVCLHAVCILLYGPGSIFGCVWESRLIRTQEKSSPSGCFLKQRHEQQLGAQGSLPPQNLDTICLLDPQQSGSWEHALQSELQTWWSSATIQCGENNLQMRKSAMSTLITQNHICWDLNSILEEQNSMKNVSVTYWSCDNFILSARFYYGTEPRRQKNTPSWEHLINLRWYEKSEWIFFADAKPADGATWERGQVRGWRLITDFHFYF